MTEDTIKSALSMHPDRPGVGRLCQELLAQLSGLPVTAKVNRSIRFNTTWGGARIRNTMTEEIGG